MEQAQREECLKVMLNGMPPERPIVDALTEDIDALAPFVDEIERNAEARGRFRQILEIYAERLRRESLGQRHSDSVQHFHYCMACNTRFECWCPWTQDETAVCKDHEDYLSF